MITLHLDERNAEMIISALLERISEMRTSNFILENKVETLTGENTRLTEKLSCSEFPNSSESGAADNG